MRKNRIIILISILFTLFFLLLIFSTIFAIINSNSKLILNGISINNIDISNLSIEEAKEKVNNELSKRLENNIIIKYQDFETTISPAEINFGYDISNIFQEAYSVGRSGNIFQNNFSILNSMYNTKNYNVDISYNEEKLNNIIDDISVKMPDIVIESSYYISDNSLIILKGSDGVVLLKDETKSLILSTLENLILENLATTKTITPLVNDKKANPINIKSIYNEIHSEAQNASVQRNPFKLNPGVKGVDFAITLDEAEHILTQDLEEYIIPLTYTDPEITINDLGDDIFPHTLSYSTTKYDEKNEARVTNLKLATEKINGIVLLPGETFSFNQTVGKRTIEAGYQEAVIYANGQAEYGLGGGICQISSTLYNAVVLANLDIIERKNHSMTVSYMDIGRDATVSYNTIDLKFKNSRSYPIRIDATVRNGTVTISIQGIKENIEYSISLEIETTQTIPYKTTYINDNSLSEGEKAIEQIGKNGYKCSTYKIISLNDLIVSRELLSTDTYKSQACIIRVKK